MENKHRRHLTSKQYLTIVLGGAVVVGVGLCLTGVSILWALLFGVNVATWLCYGYDKRMAKKDRSRVPEMVLHLLALIGGSPGAFLGQRVFHHKTRKISFQMIFWAIVTVQLLFFVRSIVMR